MYNIDNLLSSIQNRKNREKLQNFDKKTLQFDKIEYLLKDLQIETNLNYIVNQIHVTIYNKTEIQFYLNNIVINSQKINKKNIMCNVDFNLLTLDKKCPVVDKYINAYLSGLNVTQIIFEFHNPQHVEPTWKPFYFVILYKYCGNNYRHLIYV